MAGLWLTDKLIVAAVALHKHYPYCVKTMDYGERGRRREVEGWRPLELTAYASRALIDSNHAAAITFGELVQRFPDGGDEFTQYNSGASWIEIAVDGATCLLEPEVSRRTGLDEAGLERHFAAIPGFDWLDRAKSGDTANLPVIDLDREPYVDLEALVQAAIIRS